MAKNTGTGKRIGVVKNRKQVYNPKTKKWVKINTKTHKIISNSSKPFKGIRKIKKKLSS